MSAYAKLVKMMDRPQDSSLLTQDEVATSVQSVGEHLAKAKGRDVGRIGVTVYDKGRALQFCLDLIGDECRVSNAQAEDARFAINVSKETWAEVASGELAPMDAFLMGRMAISGDIDFGRRLYAKVAAKDGRADFEPM